MHIQVNGDALYHTETTEDGVFEVATDRITGALLATVLVEPSAAYIKNAKKMLETPVFTSKSFEELVGESTSFDELKKLVLANAVARPSV